MAIANEVQRILREMNEDREFSWAWHCMVACSAMDEGMEWGPAQRVAARFMYTAFSQTYSEYRMDVPTEPTQ